MATYSHETTEKIMLEIRRLMVREPGISGRRIATILGYDKDYICKLKKKIDRNIAERLDRDLIKKEISELEEIYKTLALDLYAIVTGNSTDKDKIGAFDKLFNAKAKVIQTKMDAGIFARKLGELEVKGSLSAEQNALIDQALQRLYANATEPSSDEQEGTELEDTGDKE